MDCIRPQYGRGIDHTLRASTLRRTTTLPPALNNKPSFDWEKWDEVVIRVRGLLDTETTYTLWKNFKSRGTITFIELYESRSGSREITAKI